MSATQRWLMSIATTMSGASGSSITIGPAFRSSSIGLYGVSELSVKPTRSGALSITPNTSLSNRTDVGIAPELFGDLITTLSPLQAVQLASSLNTLSGSGGGLSPLGSLQSATGIDRLRVLGPDDTVGRGAALAAGQYITKDIYIEIITDARGYTATQLGNQPDAGPVAAQPGRRFRPVEPQHPLPQGLLMRAGVVFTALLLLAGCKDEPRFEDRYDKAEKEIEARAEGDGRRHR